MCLHWMQFTGNWIQFMWWNNQSSLYSRIISCDFNLRFVTAFNPEKYIFCPSGCLGDQKFWFLSELCSWGFRNSESCSMCGRSEIQRPVLCSLGDQNFWILYCVFVGDQKFSVLSCVVWEIRKFESSLVLHEELLETRNSENHLDSYAWLKH